MTIEAKLEIRKLPPSHVSQLSSILEFADQWKKLMAIVPSVLLKDDYEYYISCENPPKYNSDHIRVIESASQKYKRPGTEILLEEWGCSGRVRPAVGHLFHLLGKAHLFRASDYVAEKILHVKPLPRPSEGPAAPVDTNIDGRFIGEMLDQMDINSSLIENIPMSSPDVNLNLKSEKRVSIPQIIVTPDADQVTNPVFLNYTNDGNETESVSSMIKFPTSVISTSSLPDLSTFPESSSDCFSETQSDCGSQQICTSTSDNCETSCILIPNLPNMTQSACDENNCPNFSILNQCSDEIIPNLSCFNKDSGLIPNLSELNQPSENFSENSGIIPNLSAFNQQSESSSQNSIIIPNVSLLHQETAAIPNFLDLMARNSTTNSIESESVNITDDIVSIPNLRVLIPESRRSSLNVSANSSISRQCTSPLPNLTLNTNLPHFAYEEIEGVTNNFNEESFTNLQGSGRFLGSGAFGKVFLAAGLLEKPVAVKKIILENVEVVNVDDAVTKQFKNEVEVLSKFKHENLLSILGYSCDGCTYCLLYEYISGGTLKDRLQNAEKKLLWKERLPIALGTAKAITYLHTAFSNPLIHRDIKTANILLDAFNKPKLGDFGITKLLNNPNTNTCTVIGTSAYMAPEALRGDISVKCDTFSFGVVLLELLTSLPTFDETRDGNDLVTHVEEKCEDSIEPLLDLTVGTWMEEGINFGEKLYSIAVQCLEEKKRRPIMVDVTKNLEKMFE